jgi:Domain of unknown function (DUF4328)
MTQQLPPGQPLANSTFERSAGLMSAVVVIAAVWTAIQWFMVIAAPSAVRTYEPYQYSFVDRSAAADIITGYDLWGMLYLVVSLIAFVLTGIWLARARRNADRIAPAEQRRDKMWVWLGWLVPIVSLWFPKQVVDDVWHSTVQNPGQPNTGWWWGSWIATGLFGGLASAAFTFTGQPRGYILEHLVLLEFLTALAMTIALAGWIRVVRTISRAQDALVDSARVQMPSLPE